MEKKLTHVKENKIVSIDNQIIGTLFEIGAVIKNGFLPESEKQKMLLALEEIRKGNLDLVLKDTVDRKVLILDAIRGLLYEEPHASIAVIGTGKMPIRFMKSIAESYGLESRNITIVNGFEHSKKIHIDDLRNHNWKGVLIGPVPHSIHGVDGGMSLAEHIRTIIGKPVEEMKTNSVSRELKVTKSSFKRGLESLLYQIIYKAPKTPSVN